MSGVEISEGVRDLLGAGHPAVLSTLGVDGRPQSCVMWASLDGEDLVMISRTFREPVRAVERSPSVSVLVYDVLSPTHYVEVRGTARLHPDHCGEVARALTRQYLGDSVAPRPGPHVVIRVAIQKVTELQWR